MKSIYILLEKVNEKDAQGCHLRQDMNKISLYSLGNAGTTSARMMIAIRKIYI